MSKILHATVAALMFVCLTGCEDQIAEGKMMMKKESAKELQNNQPKAE
jgi:hypothetical protein